MVTMKLVLRDVIRLLKPVCSSFITIPRKHGLENPRDEPVVLNVTNFFHIASNVVQVLRKHR